MLFCGIDMGSRNVKVALLEKGFSAEFYKFDTIKFYRENGRLEDGQLAVDIAGLLKLGYRKPRAVVTTGYGRQTVNLKGARNIPEIKAHVLGAVHTTGLKDFTLLDLGGQDSKVALVRDGKLVDFQTNDKCAASTGRYLENMAAVLDISLEELGRHYIDPVDLASTCAIFGETELVGKVVEGHSTESLAAGVNYTIFKRIRPMLVKLKSEQLVFTGGVAHNKALREILKQELGVSVVVPDNPQYAGALGCCVASLV